MLGQRDAHAHPVFRELRDVDGDRRDERERGALRRHPPREDAQAPNPRGGREVGVRVDGDEHGAGRVSDALLKPRVERGARLRVLFGAPHVQRALHRAGQAPEHPEHARLLVGQQLTTG